MFQTIRPALVIFALLTILTGVLYPLLITGAAQVLFPWQANGSIVTAADSRSIGSALIGQSFSTPEYFWGRLSVTAERPYNAAASGGSNYSVLNEALQEQVEARINALHAADPGNALPIPVDLVTASASGLDPHISLAAAYYQVSRIARERSLSEEQVWILVQEHTETRFLNMFGEPRVNVLLLNLALDSLQ
jgi:K+-transporting ATPase ATPase C chain